MSVIDCPFNREAKAAIPRPGGLPGMPRLRAAALPEGIVFHAAYFYTRPHKNTAQRIYCETVQK
ncbi:hypothetical protein [Agrobacterium sp. NPDC089420]|uniref:hypothetical protein n=1 Tax=Agrobacterium sp. NPDC089420 TaxID=3363918 RepID=UPI00384C5F10